MPKKTGNPVRLIQNLVISILIRMTPCPNLPERLAKVFPEPAPLDPQCAQLPHSHGSVFPIWYLSWGGRVQQCNTWWNPCQWAASRDRISYHRPKTNPFDAASSEFYGEGHGYLGERMLAPRICPGQQSKTQWGGCILFTCSRV